MEFNKLETVILILKNVQCGYKMHSFSELRHI